MGQATLVKRLLGSVTVWGMFLALSGSLAAQETTRRPLEEQPDQRNVQERRGQRQLSDLVTELQQKHQARKKLHQEMTRALQDQLTALREHAKGLERINDEKQLLGELKKHLQLTDALLGTMVEHRAILDADPKGDCKDLGSHLGWTPQAEKPAPGGPESHPAGE